MVKRFLLLGLLVLAFTGASAVISFAGGPAAPGVLPPPPPGPPAMCGPAATAYSIEKHQIVPIPAQLRRVRVVAPYLAGIAWPRTPLAFGGNPMTYAHPVAPGRYEWLVPVVEIQNEHWSKFKCVSCKEDKAPRCVYVKANYVHPIKCGPVPVAAPPPLPCKVTK